MIPILRLTPREPSLRAQTSCLQASERFQTSSSPPSPQEGPATRAGHQSINKSVKQTSPRMNLSLKEKPLASLPPPRQRNGEQFFTMLVKQN